ncbi:MAG: DUF6657 family protein [Spirochaetales bacterium]
MGEIKSALELALERTANVKGDRASLEAHENRQEGRRIVSQFLEDPSIDLKKKLKSYDESRRKQVRRGVFDALLGNLTLPNDQQALERIQSLAPAFEVVIGDKKSVDQVYDQVVQLFSQYLRDRQQLVEQLRQQFEGRMRQKEEELAKQTGQRIRLDPSQDPEFSQTLQQYQQQMQAQYTQVVDQAKEQLEGLYKE